MKLTSDVAGSVWKLEKKPGDAVAEGEAILIIESMKMEIPVEAPKAGTVGAILVAEGDAVAEGQAVVELTS